MYVKQKLPIKLTEDRRREIEHENAEIEIKVLVHAEDLEQAKATYKENTEGILKDKKQNIQVLRQGYELKEVNALEYANEDEGLIQYMSEEGEILHERPMTMEERYQYRIRFGRKQLPQD